MSRRAPLIVIAAGGTGGHVFPAEALAAELKERGCRLAVMTDRRGGRGMAGVLGEIERHYIRAGGIAGKSVAAVLKSAPELAVGFVQAWALLKRLGPDAVIGFGGYAAMPTMMAASCGGFATAIHEQNGVLGRANRILATRVKRIAISLPTVRLLPEEARGKVVHTGMPVRPAVVALRERTYDTPTEDGPLKILVTGGSQGARVLSSVVPAAVALLPEDLRKRLALVQQCRPEDLDAVRAAYAGLGMNPTLESFFSDLPERLADCHLMIGRSGASTVAEITTIGRPSILVPYPSAIDDHQTANAQAVDDAGGGWLMPEPAFTPENLAARLEALLAIPSLLEKAASAAWAAGTPDAASRLADMVLAIIPNGHARPSQEAA
jgi:UDP-N-acetylglucosamine--N-acetylmuramyl-(pentapeptide) pyrophosphoryl-undecaprenol N-acetylglucosamine transferase